MDAYHWIVVATANAQEGSQIKAMLEKTRVLNPVHIVHNGHEFLAYIRGAGVYSNRAKFPLPLLLLLDLELPGASALEILAEMQKAPPEISQIPVIVMNSAVNEPMIEQAYELGARSYLRKPFTFAQLLERGRISGLCWEIVRHW